jgi:hypothetical protein
MHKILSHLVRRALSGHIPTDAYARRQQEIPLSFPHLASRLPAMLQVLPRGTLLQALHLQLSTRAPDGN